MGGTLCGAGNTNWGQRHARQTDTLLLVRSLHSLPLSSQLQPSPDALGMEMGFDLISQRRLKEWGRTN